MATGKRAVSDPNHEEEEDDERGYERLGRDGLWFCALGEGTALLGRKERRKEGYV